MRDNEIVAVNESQVRGIIIREIIVSAGYRGRIHCAYFYDTWQ